MSDQYLSRLISFARQNKGIKILKNKENNEFEVEFDNGLTDTLTFEEVLNIKNPPNER